MNHTKKACLVGTSLVILLVILFGLFTPWGSPAQAGQAGPSAAGSVLCNVTKSAANPVLKPGVTGLWDSAEVWDPAVVHAGVNYKMYYSGSDGKNPSRIGLATSPDGNTWTKFGAGPIAGALSTCDTNGARDATVLYTGSAYQMWYEGRGTDDVWRICYASSPDGTTWTGRDAAVLEHGPSGSWDAAWVRFPSVLLDGGVYHMWFTGSDLVTNQIGHAVSPDGLSWTVDAAPVITHGAITAWDWIGASGPSVTKIGADFVMLHSGIALPPDWTIGYTRSADGVHWEKSSRLIPQGGTDEFDEFGADLPMILVEGDKARIWYSGIPASEFFEIGYAEADLCSGAAPAGSLAYLPAVQRGRPGIYTDSFGDNQSGWYESVEATYQLSYLDGEYQAWVIAPGAWVLTTPGMKAEAYVAEVQAHRMSGDYGAYGFAFGLNNSRKLDYYVFIVEYDSYAIFHNNGASWVAVKGWTYSDKIHPGTAWNQLKLVMPPDGYAQFYSNDSLLWTAGAPLMGEGIQVGLAAFAPKGAELDVRFDNVRMYRYGDTPGLAVGGPQTANNHSHRFTPADGAGFGWVVGDESNGPQLTR